MSEILEFGHPPKQAHLRRLAHARRMTLRVSQLDRKITLSVPKRTRLSEAQAFLEDKAGWVERALDKVPDGAVVGPDTHIPIEGATVLISAGAVRSIVREGDVLTVPQRNSGKRVAAYLKHRARDRLVASVDRYGASLGKAPKEIALRDPRSRWGSCSSNGRLMFSWRLIMAPPWILDYVAAHEVAHLRHMDHSAAFWDTVVDLYGPTDLARRWLRDEGPDLHRYKFSD